VEREGSVAALSIDEKQAAESRSTDFGDKLALQQQPIYIGGLSTDLVPFASRILPVIFLRQIILFYSLFYYMYIKLL
jgi:hypothetical protein